MAFSEGQIQDTWHIIQDIGEDILSHEWNPMFKDFYGISYIPYINVLFTPGLILG